MNKPRWLVALVWCAVLLGACEFLYRSAIRPHNGGINDFGAPYVGTRLWLAGRNPYDSTVFLDAWHQSGGVSREDNSPDPSASHVVYPPTVFPMLAPIAVFSWYTAGKLLVAVSIALYLTAISLMLGFIGEGWTGLTRPLFLAYALALAPVHTALYVGNVAGLAGSLLLIGISLLLKEEGLRRNGVWAALAIAAAICVKLTMGLLIVPYLVARRSWRTLAVIAGVVLLVAVAAFVLLLREPPVWIADYRANIAAVFTHGGVADYAKDNPTRFDLLNLQLPFYAIWQSRLGSTVAVLVVSAGLFAAWLLAAWSYQPEEEAQQQRSTDQRRRRTDRQNQGTDRRLLLIAVLIAIGLLAFYQRYYSGILLLAPMLWAIQQPRRTSNRIVIAICCCFLANTEAFMRQSAWFQHLQEHQWALSDIYLGPHLSWLLLLLAVVLIRQLFTGDEIAGTGEDRDAAAELQLIRPD